MKILFEYPEEQKEIVNTLKHALSKMTGNLGSCIIHGSSPKICPDDCAAKKLDTLIASLQCRRCAECENDEHHWIDSFEFPGMLGCKHCPALIDANEFDKESEGEL